MLFRSVFFITGLFLLILSATMLFPAFADWSAGDDDWRGFVISAFITSFVGGFMVVVNSGHKIEISRRQAFLLTTFSWFVLTIFAALPFSLSEANLSFTDSFFEAMSGLTTTGSTIMTNLDERSTGILLWRSLLQWLGGIGIIVMALSILPLLKVGGMELFQTESSEREKVLPRAAQLAASIGVIYACLTFACMILYMTQGMGGFDAMNHAMTTIATGGFSTHDASIGFYDNKIIHVISTLFMIIAALPFALYLRAVNGGWKPLINDSQVRFFLFFLGLFIAIITAYLYISQGFKFTDGFIYAMFNITSIMTGTGYATTDYMLWGSFAVGFMFFIGFIGGCAGSTTCAIKIFRFQIVYAVAKAQIQKLLHPHGVFPPKYAGKRIPSDVPLSVLSFIFLYGLTFCVTAVILQLMGLDYLTAMSGAATAISNVGPGLGDIIGPAGTFAPLPDMAKWVLSACMLLGRLELFTVLVVLSPQFWRS